MGRISTRFGVTGLTVRLFLPLLCLTGPDLSRAAGAPKAMPPRSPAPQASPTAAGEEKSGPMNEVHVTLFGQPCLMNGPLPKETLTLIHETSPERVPPGATVDQMKKAREKLAKLVAVPLPIEQYRDHLRKRLSAKIALEEALAQVAPKRRSLKGAESRKALDTLMKNLKEHISTLQYASFEAQQKKALEAADGDWTDSFVESLRDRYEEVIQPDPQEEFHKAIRLSRVQYVCSFDEGEEGSSHSD